MIIRYNIKRLKYNLYFGFFWVILGTIAIILDSANIFYYIYLLIGIILLGAYVYEDKNQYLTIEDGVLTKNNLIPQRIKLEEIDEIKKFAGSYRLKSSSTEMKIEIKYVDENSLKDLVSVFDNLNLETK